MKIKKYWKKYADVCDGIKNKIKAINGKWTWNGKKW